MTHVLLALLGLAITADVPADQFTNQQVLVRPADGSAISYFYIANKGRGYEVGSTYVIIESVDGNGTAFAEAVIGPGGGVVDVVLIWSDKEFTGPPTIYILGTGTGAEVEAVLER